MARKGPEPAANEKAETRAHYFSLIFKEMKRVQKVREIGNARGGTGESVLQQHDGDLCKGGHDSHGSNGYCEREDGGGLGRERG